MLSPDHTFVILILKRKAEATGPIRRSALETEQGLFCWRRQQFHQLASAPTADHQWAEQTTISIFVPLPPLHSGYHWLCLAAGEVFS